MSRRAPERSFLFVPANDAVRVPKALAGLADAVILDLEDAVAELEKSSARDCLDPATLLSARLAARADARHAGATAAAP